VQRLTPAMFTNAGLTIEDFSKVFTMSLLPAEVQDYLTTGTYVGASLNELCHAIVVDFDATVLIPQRKSAQQFNDMLDDAVKKAKK
jgi:hypothetical protein